MKFGPMDAKKKALDELMGYLDQKDGEELGEAVKPKGLGVEVTKVQKLDGEPDGDEGDKSPGVLASKEGEPDGDEAGAGMSPEEMEELIEAIQSKLKG